MPIHTYTNWNVRPTDNEEQIEPFRKYFFICDEDAKYMLVSCSAFINYLIEKQSKINH